MREGRFGPKKNKNQAVEAWFFGRGNLIRSEYTRIEMVRGHNWVRSEGGLDWVKKSKTELWRLGFG